MSMGGFEFEESDLIGGGCGESGTSLSYAKIGISLVYGGAAAYFGAVCDVLETVACLVASDGAQKFPAS
jgi:hypothetical protein